MQQRTRAMAEERVARAEAEAARRAAEETTRRSDFLARASRELGASLDLERGHAARCSSWWCRSWPTRRRCVVRRRRRDAAGLLPREAATDAADAARCRATASCPSSAAPRALQRVRARGPAARGRDGRATRCASASARWARCRSARHAVARPAAARPGDARGAGRPRRDRARQRAPVLQPAARDRALARRPRRSCRTRTGARTSSSPCCRTSCATRSRRSATRSR